MITVLATTTTPTAASWIRLTRLVGAADRAPATMLVALSTMATVGMLTFAKDSWPNISWVYPLPCTLSARSNVMKDVKGWTRM